VSTRVCVGARARTAGAAAGGCTPFADGVQLLP